LSRILAENNGGQEIKSQLDAIGSAHKVKLESVGGLDNKEEIERLTNYLK
jgi:hypothetical protein